MDHENRIAQTFVAKSFKDQPDERTNIDPARWSLVREMFAHLHDKSPSHRRDYLELMCEDDTALRLEVESLLQAHDGISVLPDCAPLPAPAIAEEVAGYRLLSRLGEGGAGTVFLARHEHWGEVALKLLPALTVQDATARARFDQEAQALEKLRHPYVCRLYESFVTEDYAGLAMAHIAGESLSKHLADRGALPFEQTVTVMRALLSAVESAHEQGIVHRDIKPSNVMLADTGTVTLIDFGISKFADNRLTRTGQMMGSPRYMSPEQWQGSGIDNRTDQWSLAALWYELLSGHPAFGADRIADVARQVLHDEPAPLPAFSIDGVSLGKSASIIKQMLGKSAAQRFDAISDVRQALDANLSGH